MTDPKTSDAPTAQKDPEDWVTGDEPMTGPQASYLQTLAQEAGEEVDDVALQGTGVRAHRGAAGEDGPRHLTPGAARRAGATR